MGDAHRFHHYEDNRAANVFTSVVLLVGLIGADVEVGNVAITAAQRQADAR